MWQRFTERARKVVFYSQEEAQRFGEGYVSTEHLLLGLLRVPDSTACRVLVKIGVDPEVIRKKIEKELPRGDSRPNQDMTLTPRAKRVIDLAYDAARGLENNYIGTEHLLLGLIREGDGLAGRVLTSFSLDFETVAKAVIAEQGVDRASYSRLREERQETIDVPADGLPTWLRVLNSALSEAEDEPHPLCPVIQEFLLHQLAEDARIVEVIEASRLRVVDFKRILIEAVAAGKPNANEPPLIEIIITLHGLAGELNQALRPVHLFLAYLGSEAALVEVFREHGLHFDMAREIIAKQIS